uniref:Uncharacterized protein n=1 Tax=Rangifer tarandus platyrhynchus TaxID=3082113 RepID=A0ACB0DY82_RANTA|nr:unnamed protein product [Rangifer tarandus platyrhynchus]
MARREVRPQRGRGELASDEAESGAAAWTFFGWNGQLEEELLLQGPPALSEVLEYVNYDCWNKEPEKWHNEPSFSHPISAPSGERERSVLPRHVPSLLTRRGSSFRWKMRRRQTPVGMATHFPKASDLKKFVEGAELDVKKGRDQSLRETIWKQGSVSWKKRGGLCGFSLRVGWPQWTDEKYKGHVLGPEGDVEQVKLRGWRGSEDLTSSVCQQPRQV